MIGLTHIVFGLAIGKTLDLRIGTVILFAVLPDIDRIFVFASPLIRNGVTHSLIGGVFLCVCVMAGFDRSSTAKSSFVGYISHLSLDILCINGLMILYPIEKFYSLGLTTETDLVANFSALSLSTLLVVFESRDLSVSGLKNFS